MSQMNLIVFNGTEQSHWNILVAFVLMKSNLTKLTFKGKLSFLYEQKTQLFLWEFKQEILIKERLNVSTKKIICCWKVFKNIFTCKNSFPLENFFLNSYKFCVKTSFREQNAFLRNAKKKKKFKKSCVEEWMKRRKKRRLDVDWRLEDRDGWLDTDLMTTYSELERDESDCTLLSLFAPVVEICWNILVGFAL